jgi:hypothetical protein
VSEDAIAKADAGFARLNELGNIRDRSDGDSIAKGAGLTLDAGPEAAGLAFARPSAMPAKAMPMSDLLRSRQGWDYARRGP